MEKGSYQQVRAAGLNNAAPILSLIISLDSFMDNYVGLEKSGENTKFFRNVSVQCWRSKIQLGSDNFNLDTPSIKICNCFFLQNNSEIEKENI